MQMGLGRSAVGLVVLCALGAAAKSLEEVLKDQKNLTTFRGLVDEYADFYKDLPDSGVTVIAPNDGAFIKGQGWDADQQAIPVWLRYGVLRGEVKLSSMSPGDTQTVPTLLNDSRYANVSDGQKVFITMQPEGEVVISSGLGTHITVVGTDIPFDNGLVQVVESLFVVPRRLEPSIRDSYTDLTAFLGALYRAGLVDEFAQTPNATIFAPHNSAFQRLAGAFDSMDDDEFRRVLRYHIVPNGVLRSSDLENASNLTTAAKTPLHVTRYINDIYVNTARIIQTDLLIANGIVQMIDNVLNVEQNDVRPDVSQSAQAPVFTATASVATGEGAPVPFTSALPCTASCSTSQAPRPTGEGLDDEGGSGDDENGAATRGPGAAGAMAIAMGAAAGVLGMGFVGIA
ncbi:FAS1 domain-containing protein [Plectosphaerella cucumerina]|uniref:FAS1 domain-containing protein n=1 Tax=Plectosphaerella cucumerina TaxID=40658 RepID=A0A8K0T798_9PEZI|nr:FAS1 domain-containing protein [Plectosphaerella cucumerina]